MIMARCILLILMRLGKWSFSLLQIKGFSYDSKSFSICSKAAQLTLPWIIVSDWA